MLRDYLLWPTTQNIPLDAHNYSRSNYSNSNTEYICLVPVYSLLSIYHLRLKRILAKPKSVCLLLTRRSKKRKKGIKKKRNNILITRLSMHNDMDIKQFCSCHLIYIIIIPFLRIRIRIHRWTRTEHNKKKTN